MVEPLRSPATKTGKTTLLDPGAHRRTKPLRSPATKTGKTRSGRSDRDSYLPAATEPGHEDREDARARHRRPRPPRRRYGARPRRPGRRVATAARRRAPIRRYGARPRRPGRPAGVPDHSRTRRRRYGARPRRPGRPAGVAVTPTGRPGRYGARPRRPGRPSAANCDSRSSRTPLRSPATKAGKTAAHQVRAAFRVPAATEPGHEGREDPPRTPPGCVIPHAATEPGHEGREDLLIGFTWADAGRPLRSPATKAGKTLTSMLDDHQPAGRYGARPRRPGRLRRRRA